MNFNMTMIGQMLFFAVFVWFTMKYIWPHIMTALEERKAKIADGLAAAERGQHEQELAKKGAAEKLHEAKQQAAEILARAEKRGAEIVDEAKVAARAEGDRLIAAAEAEKEQMVNKAREDLRAKVGELALLGAEKILRREIDAEAHKDLVDQVANQI